MKLKSFRIKNYKSIQDTGEISLGNGRIAIFAGQNESGKSSILEGLAAFENAEFESDSIPFDFESPIQEVSCTYEIEESDSDFWDEIEKTFGEQNEIERAKVGSLIDIPKLKRTVKDFKITRTLNPSKKVQTSIPEAVFQIFRSSILEEDVNVEAEVAPVKKERKKIIELTDDQNSEVAELFWNHTPKIILFNDFCDLLPDTFSLKDLKSDKKDSKGYKAVKNFEKISGADFKTLYSLDDLKRDSIEEKHNEAISIDFTKAWKQQIHGDNRVKIAYKFEKRSSEDDTFVSFYIETKDKQKIRPRMRSKGLVWFLSFWMELQASGHERELIVLADEPGLYLHIKAQTDILNVFESLTKTGHQFLYSTHSPNLIRTDHLERIHLIVNDKTKGTLIENITSSKIDSQNKQDALQPVANAIGFSVSDFGLTNKKSVILEGVSDFYYYSAMRTLLKRDIADYAFIPGIGVRKQYTLVSFCIGYGISWVAIFDDDSSRGKDSQKTYEEIKEHLFEKDEGAAASKMYITIGISSVENLLHLDDLKLIDDKIVQKTDPAESIGEKRKIVFAKSFFEKVSDGSITKKKIHIDTITRFNQIFDWIDTNL